MIWNKKSKRERRRQRQLRRRRWREKRKARKIKRRQWHESRRQAKSQRKCGRRRGGKNLKKPEKGFRRIMLFLFSFVMFGMTAFFVERNLLGTYTKQVYAVEQKKIIPAPIKQEKGTLEKVSIVLLAEHTISNPGSTEDRNWNMWLVSQILNREASVIKPGETFSYLETVGNTTAEKGFRMAGVINGGKSAQDYGGGVCQVTTTYNSALIAAGIPTHAMVHTVASKYVVPARGDREAAVAYNSKIDFKFANTTHDTLKTLLIAEGGNTTARIFKIEYQKL